MTSRIVVRPSSVGKAILILTAVMTFFALRAPVLVGPIATLWLLGLADGGLAWWRLRRARIDIVPLRTVAAPPELLSCSITVSDCSVPLAIALLTGQRVAGRVIVEPGSGPNRAQFFHPRLHRRNYLDYRVVVSTVGLALPVGTSSSWSTEVSFRGRLWPGSTNSIPRSPPSSPNWNG